MLYILKPYREDKNLGKAYNDAMKLIPDGGTACLMDIDTMFLLPEQPAILNRWAQQYPDAVLTCLTNRISPNSEQLNYDPGTDITKAIEYARNQQRNGQPPKPTLKCISGMLMIVPKQVWQRVPFRETGKCLGVDTHFSRDLHATGVPILIVQDVYIWHTYRIENGSKAHLL